MIDFSRVRTGFHFECLFAAPYLDQLLLSAIDTGDIPTRALLPIPLPPGQLQIDLQVPVPQRDYAPDPAAPLPTANPASLRVTAIQDGDPLVPGDALHHVLLTVAVTLDISDPATGTLLLPNAQATVDVLVSLLWDSGPYDADVRLMQTNVRLGLQTMNVAGPLVTTLAAPPFGIPPADIRNAVARFLPSALPFDITNRNGPLRSVQIRHLPGDAQHPDAIGLYANLLLRLPTTAERRPTYHPVADSTAAAQNFLPQGQHYALAMSPLLFSGSGNLNAVGRHFQELISELRETGRIDVFGRDVPVNIPILSRRFKVEYVRMFPRGDGLRLSIRCRYDLRGIIQSLDPQGTLQIDFRPEWDADHVMRWNTHIRVTTGGLARLFQPLFNDVTFFVNRFVAPLFYRQEYASDPGFATVMDLLAATVTVARRRWDPFYTSLHQVRVDVADVQSNRDGLGLWGTVRGLGRKRFPVDDLVIRDKTRDADGLLSGLRYVVPGLGTPAVDLVNHHPATDRVQLTPLSPVPDHPDATVQLVTLSLDDIRARLAQDGFAPPVVYRLLRVQPFVETFDDHEETTLVRLMGISLRERDRINDALWAERHAEARQQVLALREAELRADAVAHLPTGAAAEDIEAEFRIRLHAAAVEGALIWLGSEPGIEVMRARFDALMRLELHPHEWGQLQDMGVLEVQGYRLIERQGRFYYRDDSRWRSDEPSEDEPDDTLIDNLASLPHILRLDIDTNPLGHVHVRARAPATVLETGHFVLRQPDGSVAEARDFAGLEHAEGHAFGAEPAGDRFAGWRLCWQTPGVDPEAPYLAGEVCTPPHEPP